MKDKLFDFYEIIKQHNDPYDMLIDRVMSPDEEYEWMIKRMRLIKTPEYLDKY
jgi:hypothetical protein